MNRPPKNKLLSFVLEKVNCGKGNCRLCGGVRYEHGPYWYAYYTNARGGASKIYVGIDRDAWINKVGYVAPKHKDYNEKVSTPKKKDPLPKGWSAIFSKRTATPKTALAILGLRIKPPFLKAVVKAAFKKLIVQNHPDKGGCKEKAAAINAAFQYLEPYLK